MKTPYEILELKKTATFEEVKSAYRRLSKLYHPDLNDGQNHEKMVEINGAYEFLKDKYLNTNMTRGSNTTNTQNNKAHAQDDINDFERDGSWEAFWARWEANAKAEYKSQCTRMRAKIERNLEPIRQENMRFMKEILEAKNYEELMKISQYYSAKFEDMINCMYEYTQTHHRYGIPTNYAFGTEINKKTQDISTLKGISFLNVKSSYISAVSYNCEKKVLFVKFANDVVYAYYDLSINVYNGLMNSSSIGSYFAINIKDHYESKQVDL